MKPTIQTYTGRMLNPCRLRPEDVDVRDIAHALALKVRYTGHSPVGISIAQHSVLVADRCPNHELWGLMHDAPEYCLPDLARPIKQELRVRCGSFFDDLEHEVMQVICKRFGLDPVMPDEVRRADDNMLATEALCLFGHTPAYADWHHRPENGFAVYDRRTTDLPWNWQAGQRAWTPEVAEHYFLSRFRTLYKGDWR